MQLFFLVSVRCIPSLNYISPKTHFAVITILIRSKISPTLRSGSWRGCTRRRRGYPCPCPRPSRCCWRRRLAAAAAARTRPTASAGRRRACAASPRRTARARTGGRRTPAAGGREGQGCDPGNERRKKECWAFVWNLGIPSNMTQYSFFAECMIRSYSAC